MSKMNQTLIDDVKSQLDTNGYACVRKPTLYGLTQDQCVDCLIKSFPSYDVLYDCDGDVTVTEKELSL